MYPLIVRHNHQNWSILILLFSLGITSSAWTQETSRTEPAVVEVKATLSKDVRLLDPHFLGCNVSPRGSYWKDKRFVELAKQLCATIRYPNFNWWDWKTGWFFKDLKDLPESKAKLPVDHFTLEDLKLAYESTGAEPIFLINMLTSDLDYQLDMLRAAAKLGLPIKRVELSNELYLQPRPRFKERFPTGKDYGKEASRWTAAIKAEFPEAQIAAIGVIPFELGYRQERIATWNKSSMSELKGVDAITLHWYTGSNLPQLSYPLKNMPEEWFSPDLIASQTLSQAFKTPEGLTNFLGQPFVNLALWIEQAEKEIPGNLRWWITEYNLLDRSEVTAGTWAHGLFTATMTLNLLQILRVELVCVHTLSGPPIVSLTFGFIPREGGRGVGLRASGHTIALLAAAMRGKTSAQPIAFQPTPKAYTLKKQEYPTLVGWAFKNKENSAVVLMNLSSDTVRIAAGNLGERGDPWIQLAADPRKEISADSGPSRIEGKLQEAIVLPPYSLTKIGK